MGHERRRAERTQRLHRVGPLHLRIDAFDRRRPRLQRALLLLRPRPRQDRAPVYRLDGNTLRAATPCPAEEGPFTVHLPIPSGILAIGNDFREYGKPDPDERQGEAQEFKGESLPAERAAILLGARRGAITVVLHEDEGGVYRRADGTMLVGRYSRLSETETGIPAAKNLGGYWRAFADGDQIPASAERVARVPVEPGTYAFTIHRMGLDRAAFGTEEWHHPAVEIEIRRITDHGSTNA